VILGKSAARAAAALAWRRQRVLRLHHIGAAQQDVRGQARGNGRQMLAGIAQAERQVGRIDVGADQQAQRIESCAWALVWLAMSACA
jgi:hypothetical protein